MERIVKLTEIERYVCMIYDMNRGKRVLLANAQTPEFSAHKLSHAMSRMVRRGCIRARSERAKGVKVWIME